MPTDVPEYRSNVQAVTETLRAFDPVDPGLAQLALSTADLLDRSSPRDGAALARELRTTLDRIRELADVSDDDSALAELLSTPVRDAAQP